VFDHAALREAWKGSRQDGGCILPLYIVQEAVLLAPDSDARHWGFIRESLTELRQNLAGLGAPFVEKGVPLFHIDRAARGRIRGKDAEAIKNRIRGTEKRF